MDTSRLERITPADAGKTPALTGFIGAGWDHPRGCGENRTSELRAALKDGSPPRMRGKRRQCIPYIGTAGITPADAGKTNGNL